MPQIILIEPCVFKVCFLSRFQRFEKRLFFVIFQANFLQSLKCTSNVHFAHFQQLYIIFDQPIYKAFLLYSQNLHF